MKKLVIVTPAYNTSKYIDDFLSSLLTQSFRDFDLYIVDDGSDDDTANRIKNYLKDQRVKFYTKKNGGVSSARNYALNKIYESGKNYRYIYFCDSDDQIGDDCLNKIVSECDRTNADYGLFSVVYQYKSHRESFSSNIHRYSKVIDNESIMKQYFRYGARWYKKSFTEGFLNNKIFLYSKIKDLKFDEDLKRAEDFDFFLRLAPSLEKGIIVPDAWYFYRKRKSSLTYSIPESGDLQVCLKHKEKINSGKYYIRRSLQHKLIRAIYTTYCLAVTNKDIKRQEEIISIYKDFKIKVPPFFRDIKMLLLLSAPMCIFNIFVHLRGRATNKISEDFFYE